MPLATDEITAARTEIEESLIEPYGNTLYKRTYTEADNGYGEIEETFPIDVSFIGVLDQYITARADPRSAGRLKDGESLVITKHDAGVNYNDIVVSEGVEYRVTNVNPLKAADVVVAIVLTVGLK